MRRFDLNRINLYTIFSDLLRNLWVIVLVAVTGFIGASTYYNYIHEPLYVSSMTVSINLSGYTNEATALSLARTVEIAETLDDVFQSDAMQEVVQKDIGRSISGTLTSNQIIDTNLVKINITDSTPDRAFETLTSISKNYKKVTDDVFSNVIINVVVNPQMPSGPAGSVTPFKAGVLCGVVSAIAITFLIILISYMRDTVKNISDIENELAAKLFGTVMHVKSINKKLPDSKRRLIVTNPLVNYGFINSFKKMAIKLESLKRTKKLKSFMITSVAENEGKTTTAVNLAVLLAQNGHKVLLLDCDFKKPAVFRFFNTISKDRERDIHRYLTNGGNITDFLKLDTETGLYIANCVEACSDSAEKLNSKMFSNLMTAVKSEFDFVIVDTPPCGITVDAEVISSSVDAALMVVRQDYVDITTINDNLDSLNKCYISGCIFSDVMSFGNIQPEEDFYMYSEQ